MESGRYRLQRPPRWLWPILLVAQVAVAAALTSYTYFFFDDFLFLQQARTQHFSLSYLREPLYEHFSPLSRILDAALVHISSGSFALAHDTQLFIYAAAIAAFALIAVTVLGNSWAAFILTTLFGQSLFLLRMLRWWTATANTLPATVFMLLAIAGYLRWHLGGSRLWLAASIGAYALALADYETAMLFPIYLGLIVLLVLEDSFDPRVLLARLLRERWAWLCYIALASAGLYNYYEYYFSPTPRPSIHELVHFLWIALVESFVPALVGIKDPEAALSSSTIVIACSVLFIATTIVFTLYIRPRAWRCLAAFSVVFLVTMIPIGLNRVKAFGVGVGQELDYQQSVQFMFFVLAAFAISLRWGGQRSRTDKVGRWFAKHQRAFAPAACSFLLAGYGALYITSAHAMSKATWEPRIAHAYIKHFLAGAKRAEELTGRQPDLIDHEVPENVQFASAVPFNHYDQLFGIFDSDLRIDQIASPTYFVTNEGALLPVSFDATAVGDLTAPKPSPTGRPASTQGSVGCVPTGSPATRLHVRLSAPQNMPAQWSGLPYGLLVKYRTPTRAPVAILLGNSGNVTVDEAFPHVWGPGAGGELAPLSIKTAVDELAFDVPGGTCVTSLAFGHFSPAGAPLQ